MQVINQFTFADYFTHVDDEGNKVLLVGEQNFGDSLTDPSQAMTPRDIITRYVKGRDVQVFEGSYEVPDDVPLSWEMMSELERVQFAKQFLYEKARLAELGGKRKKNNNPLQVDLEDSIDELKKNSTDEKDDSPPKP